MGALPLSEAVQRAQDAMSGGNYRLAVETCRRVLDQFPEYAAAHRLLGEAYLEQHQASEAKQAFREALLRDPQDLSPYLGLGLIAEEGGDARTALAYLQAAWEIAPQRTDLRDHVVRLSQQIYGSEGRLQLTRAGLGSLHYHAGRWSRAVSECAAVLADHPDRIDVRIRLAETLWRRGEDDRAGAAARTVLERSPNAVVALLILADIERRHGNSDEATTLRDRARAVDPDGARATQLLGPVTDDQADFFLPEQTPMVEELAETAVEPERPKIAPAPDFTAPEPSVVSERPAPAPETVLEGPPPVEISLPTDEEIEGARPADAAAKGYTDVLRSLEGEGFQPFSAVEFGAEVEPPAPPAPVEEPVVEPPAPEAAAPEAEAAAPAEEEVDLEALFGISSDQEIAAARPPEETPRGYTGILRSLEDTGLEPFSLETPEEQASEPAAQAAEIDEALISETPAVESVAAEPEVEAPAESPAEATPTAEADAGLAADWDKIDDEIRGAIPGEMPRGYTDQLRSIDASGVAPFSFDDEEIPFFQRGKRADAEAAAPEQPAGEATPAAEQPEELEDLEGLRQLGEPDDEEVNLAEMLLREEDLAALGGAPAEVEGEPAEHPSDVTTDEMQAPALFDEFDTAGQAPASEAQAVPFAGVVEPGGMEDVAFEQPQAEVRGPSAVDVVVEEGMAAPEAAADDTDSARMTADRLGVGPELFERARTSKEALVESGEISGEAALPGTDYFRTKAAESVPPAEVPAALERVAGEAETPEERLALTESLVASGQGGAALEQCRWIYRHAPDVEDRLIEVLKRITSVDSPAASGAHRLLGAVYRRRGQVQIASYHYALSLAGDRQAGEKRG